MDLTVRLPQDGQIDAGVERGRHAGLEIGTISVGTSACVTVDCSERQVDEMVRQLVLDWCRKAPADRVRDLIEEIEAEIAAGVSR
jgi:hypothetical protein